FVLAVPDRHPLAGRERLQLDELADQRLLPLGDGHCLREQALDGCQLSGAHDRSEVRATSLETRRQMVAATVGITPRPIPAAPHRAVPMAWRRSSAMEAFLRQLPNEFRGRPERLLAAPSAGIAPPGTDRPAASGPVAVGVA